MKFYRLAFSMIELMIVIIILGIVAAIAIPRMSSASKNSGDAALCANLATLRNAIDWYYEEHNRTFPGAHGDGVNAPGSATAFINQLTRYSNAQGKTSPTKTDTCSLGPYIRGKFPTLTVGINAGSNKVTIVDNAKPLAADTGNGSGWIYNVHTGQIIANSNQTGAAGITYDRY